LWGGGGCVGVWVREREREGGGERGRGGVEEVGIEGGREEGFGLVF